MLVSVFLLLQSCNDKDNTKEPKSTALELKNTAARKKLELSRTTVKLTPTATKAVESWKEYQTIKEFIKQYNSISQLEALSNATELSELATHLKDSIIDKKLKNRAAITRLNILQNECLRLKDMENIAAITSEEVTLKVTDILAAFSGVNAKLNSVYQINALQNELQLDPDFEKILLESGIDTLKPPKPTRKSAKSKKYNKRIMGKKSRKNFQIDREQH